MLEFRGAEIQQQAMAYPRRREVAQYLRVIGRRHRRARLDLENDRLKANEVHSVIAAKNVAFVSNLARHFRLEWNLAALKLNG